MHGKAWIKKKWTIKSRINWIRGMVEKKVDWVRKFGNGRKSQKWLRNVEAKIEFKEMGILIKMNWKSEWMDVLRDEKNKRRKKIMV